MSRTAPRAHPFTAAHRAERDAVTRQPASSPGHDFDLIVIGTGAAGMAAAIRADELGHPVMVVEGRTLGGTCVNVGCIPSKYLLAAAEHLHAARSGFPGIAPCRPELDWPAVLSQKRELVESLRGEKYENVLAAHAGVTLLRGRARLVGDGGVDVDGALYRARKLVVATGTSPWRPPIPGIDDVHALDSTTAMELDALPGSMIVLGAGSVGLELGQAFARFGTRVTVLELRPRILPDEDEEASEELRQRLEEEGIDIRTGVRATRAERCAAGVAVHVDGPGAEEVFEAERLLVATGRRANTAGLGLESAGVELDRHGFIRVDPGMRTSNPDIFAAGDVTGGPGFVYVAAASGRIAAENALKAATRALDHRGVPRVTFTSPQVAAVGLTASEARSRGLAVEERRLELEHLARARVTGTAGGWVKIVAEAGQPDAAGAGRLGRADGGRILGVHVVAPNGGELLGEATLAVRLGLTVRDLTETLHPYLTWTEGLKLAAQAFTTDPARLSCCA